MLVEKSGFDTRMVMVMNEMSCQWDSTLSVPVTKSMFKAMVKYLVELRKKEDKSYALVLRNDYKDEKSEVIFATALEKHTSDEGKSYSLTFTFDPEDISSDAELINVTSREVFEFINTEMNNNTDGGDSFNFNCQTGGSYNFYCALRGVVVTLKELSRSNALNEDKKVEFKGYFTIEADVEDGGKVFTKFTPSEEMKQLIKDDSSIEDKKKEEDSKEETQASFEA